MDMEETHDNSADTRPSDTTWWSSDLGEKFGSVSLDPKAGTSSSGEANNYSEQEKAPPQTASEIIWRTGMLSEPISNGFYSVVPEKRLKELFFNIPTLDEIYAVGVEGSTADIILVDTEKDKKLSMLRQLIVTLGRSLKSNPAAMIKKIAGLVSDFYKRPSSDLSPGKAVLEEASHALANRGIQMLGHIKQASCRPRAILFKVLADAVGLESRLMVGLPDEGTLGGVDSHKHLSVIVVLNSVEHLVDLMRSPGQLIPFSTKAVHMAHTSAVGESDSAENDSCDSPLEPNSPLYGFSERVDPDSNEKDEGPHHQRRMEASLNVAGPSLRNMMLRSTSIDRTLNLSHTEPNIANAIWRRSRRKVIAEQRTASSSCRSEGASTSEVRRIRRRSISITPEISDDIARAVRAMNETLKQNRLSREHGDERSFLSSSGLGNTDSEHQTNVSGVDHHGREEISGGRSALYAHLRGQSSSQRAVSLPTSPHETRGGTSERGLTLNFKDSDEAASTWNRVLESPMFQNMPLLPFQEWNIEYRELTVGTRVGIGFFGEVFRGIWNGTDVAIKVFLEQDLTSENMKDFCNEISILGRLRHPNVILFLGACTRPPHLSMVTEYMEMGSLYYLMHISGQKNKLSWRRRLKMLRDICRGLMCIHRMKIVHRDIKSANCLVNKHWIVKICDFGLSRIMTDDALRDSSSAGTPEWMAPELIRNEPFSEKCDIFSFGVIMWELCTLSRPWEGVPPERVVYAVGNQGLRLEIPEGPLGRLIADCWAEPEQRPTCEQILTRLLDCEYSLC